MKTVYADFVFLVNFFADYVLLYVSSYSIHIKVKNSRLLLSAALGGAYAVVAAILPTGRIAVLFFSFIMLILMCFVAFYGSGIKAFVRLVINMYLYSFILCGILSLWFSGSETMVTTLLVSCVGLVIATRYLKADLLFKKDKKYVDVVFFKESNEIRAELLCDTGNILKDPVTLLPVIIVSESLVSDKSVCSTRTIPFVTVAGRGKLIVAKFDAVYLINGKSRVRINAVVGVCPDEEITVSGYNGLIPAVLVDNIY